MAKRSEFKRIEKDAYQTIDNRAFPPLLPHIRGLRYAEPCFGAGLLVDGFKEVFPSLTCTYRADIETGECAITGTGLDDRRDDYDYILTNPPWGRKLLHPMIDRFSNLAPTFLLFDSDWAFTKQAKPYLSKCYKIVTVGRLKWIPGTTMSGKDNVAWFCFDPNHDGSPPLFYGKQ